MTVGRRGAGGLLAGLVAVGALVAGGSWVLARPGESAGGLPADTKLTPAGLVACSAHVAEGTVARITPGGEEGAYEVVLRVERSYRPVDGPAEVVFGAVASDARLLAPGTRMLAVVFRSPDEPALTFREGGEAPGEAGEDVGPVRDELEYGRKWVARALPDAEGLPCETRG